MHNCTNKSNTTCWRAPISLDVLYELHIYFPLDRTVFSELSSPVCLGNTEFIAQHYFEPIRAIAGIPQAFFPNGLRHPHSPVAILAQGDFCIVAGRSSFATLVS